VRDAWSQIDQKFVSTTGAIKLAPEAVIGVLSKGHEFKDLEIGPNVCLA
jgi:hypothetical protein